MAAGIPHDLIPFTHHDYKIKTKNHLDYLSMRQKAEALDYSFCCAHGGTSLLSTEETVVAHPVTRPFFTDLPSRCDVLLGKGRPIQFSPGNQRLELIVDEYLDKYHDSSTSKLEKTALAAEIVRRVKDRLGVRFLSKSSGIWMEVGDEMARDKVSHMFRHQKQKIQTGNHSLPNNMKRNSSMNGKSYGGKKGSWHARNT